MITRNLWTSGGLVNGTMGTVYDMVWEDGVEDPFATMPALVLVAVDEKKSGSPVFLFPGLLLCQRKQSHQEIHYAAHQPPPHHLR